MANAAVRHVLCVPLVNRLRLRRRFRREYALLRGQPPAGNSHSSILHFSVNKAATQYAKAILARCATECGLLHVDFSDLAFNTALPYFSRLTAQEMLVYAHVFIPNGYLYSAFGSFVQGIPNLDKYKSIVIVRDPRDVLTSKYFSIAFSHEPPGDERKRQIFLERRARAQCMGVDEFVLAEAGRLRRVYEEYMHLATTRGSVHIATYEAMIADFALWLDNILEFCRLTIDAQLRRQLIEEAHRSDPGSEDIYRHLRQRAPGDHRRKLRAETIKKLDEDLGPALEFFRYV